MRKPKMFIGGMLAGAAGVGAASSLGSNLGKAALARLIGGKGAGRQFLENELGISDEISPEEPATPEESSDPSSDVTIRITKGGEIIQEAKKGAKVKKKKKKKGRSPLSGLTAAQREVYRRGLAAYMSSGNRPKTSQHAWAMARVKSAFGKREAAKIAAGKGKKKKK